MKKTYILLMIALVLLSQSASSQSKQDIVGSGNYYFGQATAGQEQEARDRALKQLSEQIAVNVQSFSERDLVDKNGDVKDAYRNLIHTYSQATLRNVQSVAQKTSDGIEVFSYIAKAEVGKIFEERKALVKNIYEKAVEFEQAGNITDALKYYYFAILLMNSIPERTLPLDSQNLITEIPGRINAVINATKFMVTGNRRTSEKEREIELRIEAAGKPALQADFTFWDGTSQVSVHAVDGVGYLRLYGASAEFKELNIDMKYQFYESRQEINEVAELWDLVVKPVFKNSRVLPLQITVASRSMTSEPRSTGLALAASDSLPPTVSAKIIAGTEHLVELLCSNDASKIRTVYGKDPFLSEKLVSLVKFNKVLSVSYSGSSGAAINRTMTGWEVRQIPLLCSYPSLRRQSTEYLIIDFTNNGEIDDVNFGTLKTIYSDFVQKAKFGNDWENRQVIIKFMERYRTAFMTRNMTMLDSLFADEAVIIIGRELKKTKRRDDVSYAKIDPAQPDYQYTQYTKAEYLKNQRRVFQTQRDIMLGFSTFKISRKNDGSATYGISTKQHYASSSYADEGHLFLLVDFQQNQPQIYVRSWQPHEWNDDALIKLSNFRVNK